MKKKLICMFFFLSLMGCEKENIESGIVTKVTGKLSDFQGKPIVNAVVKIGEFKDKFVADGGSFDYFLKYIDSTSTNNNGEYEITFKTTGEGSSYKLMIDNRPIDQSYYGYSDFVEIKNIGNSFTFNDTNFVKLYPCDVTITMNNIQIFPIVIDHDSTRKINSPEITSNSTFVKRIFINRFGIQKITFLRLKPDGKHQKAVFTFPASNSELLTTQNINLTDSDFVDI